MEKLKAKHIKPYPIGVNGLLIRWNNGKYGKLIGILSQPKDEYFEDGIVLMVEDELNDISSCMPASTNQITLGLRPKDDVFTGITHKGKTFIPAKILFPVEEEAEKAFDLDGIIPEYWIVCSSMDFGKHLEYWQTKLLFDWSIDVFGLLKEKFAFNLNEFNHE